MADEETVESLNALDLPTFIDQFIPQFHMTFQPQSASSPYQITIQSSQTIGSEDADACFNLVAATSQSHYANSSGGWRPRAKKKEMKFPDLKYLLVRQGHSSEILGFASFMLTYEDGIEVVYLYEIHLSETIRRSGLGKHLIALVEQVGQKAGMKKMMLTIFEANKDARGFYERQGFSVDEFSPPKRELRGGVIVPDYAILSKALNIKRRRKK